MKNKVVTLLLTAVLLTGCNSESASTNNVEIETETQQTETGVIAVEETETEIVTETQATSNGGSYETQFEKAEEIYCQFEDITPVTLYAIEEGSFLGDPNASNGKLMAQGAYAVGDEFTFDQKVTYNEVNYYVLTRDNGLIVLAEESHFSETKATANSEGDDYVIRPATDEEKQQSQETQAELEQGLKDAGFTDAEIEAIVGGGAQYIGPQTEISTPNSVDEMPDELWELGDGTNTY